MSPPSSRKQHQRRLDADQIAELVAEYQAGLLAKELATRWGINRHTVMKHLRASGVELRRQGIAEADIPEVVRLYESGLSLARIGERYGCEHSTVRNVLLKMGVKMRKPWPEPRS